MNPTDALLATLRALLTSPGIQPGHGLPDSPSIAVERVTVEAVVAELGRMQAEVGDCVRRLNAAAKMAKEMTESRNALVETVDRYRAEVRRLTEELHVNE